MPVKTPLQSRVHEMIEELRDRGINQIDVANAAGVSKGTITQLLDGGIKSIKMENALRIEDRYGYNHQWLVMGRGPKMSHARDSCALEIHSKDKSLFERLDVRAACGNGAINDDYPEVMSLMVMPTDVAHSFIGTVNKSGTVKIITASKDSMSPTINPDDLLFVDTSVIEYMGETVYLLLHDGELVCKRLSRAGRDIIVSSDNKNYPQWKWDNKPDTTRIVGRVIRVLPIQFKKFSGD